MEFDPSLSPLDQASKLIQSYVSTSRSIQLEKSTGRPITNTNYWMMNTIDNIIKSIEMVLGEYRYINKDKHPRYKYWHQVIEHLKSRRDDLISEEHSFEYPESDL